MGDDIDAILGTPAPRAAAPATPAGGGDDIDSILGPAPAPAQQQPAQPSTGTAVARGALQGASMGFGDEASALIDTGVSKVPGLRSFAQLFQDASLPAVNDPNLTYQQRRDAYRAKNTEAQQAHPIAYGAGEIGGGLATMPLLPGGAAVAGVKGAAVAGVKAGAAMGLAQGLGSSEADLTKGDFGRAFKDAAISGLAGAATGGVLGAAGGKLVADAQKNASGWVVKDIIGQTKGASTATARQHLAQDAETAARLLDRDRPLDKAVNSARHGGVDELRKVQGVLQERLAGTAEKLDPHWQAVDKLLDRKGVRAGDLVQHLDSRIEELRASGLTTDSAEATALEGISKRIQGARDWGHRSTFNPAAKVQGGGLDGMTAGDAIVLLEKQRKLAAARPAELHPDDLGAEIQRIRAAATSKGFDPETVVPARQIQRLWSDEAGIAYKSHGGINGTAAFEKKLEVASHLRDFRDQVLTQAAGNDPKVVAELRALNADYSGYKRMQEVIDQRLNAATANAGGASVPANVKGFVHKLAHGGGLTGVAALALTGHPIPALALGAAQLGVAGKRSLDRDVARAVTAATGPGGADAGFARAVLGFMQRGIPQATAIQMARSAAPGGLARELGGSVADQFGGGEPQPETPP